MIKRLLKRNKWNLYFHYPKPQGWVEKYQVVITNLTEEMEDVFRLGYKKYDKAYDADEGFRSYAFIIFGFGVSLEITKR